MSPSRTSRRRQALVAGLSAVTAAVTAAAALWATGLLAALAELGLGPLELAELVGLAAALAAVWARCLLWAIDLLDTTPLPEPDAAAARELRRAEREADRARRRELLVDLEPVAASRRLP